MVSYEMYGKCAPIKNSAELRLRHRRKLVRNLAVVRKALKPDLAERRPPVAGDAKAGEPKAKPANELVERAKF